MRGRKRIAIFSIVLINFEKKTTKLKSEQKNHFNDRQVFNFQAIEIAIQHQDRKAVW